MTPTPEELYAQREQRFNDVVALKKPDRVPVIPLVTHYFPTKVRGVSNRDAGYDHALRYRCMKEAVLEFGWDYAPANGLFPSQSMDALGVKQVKWPGGDLAAGAERAGRLAGAVDPAGAAGAGARSPLHTGGTT